MPPFPPPSPYLSARPSKRPLINKARPMMGGSLGIAPQGQPNVSTMPVGSPGRLYDSQGGGMMMGDSLGGVSPIGKPPMDPQQNGILERLKALLMGGR